MMTSRERIRAIIAGEPADRSGFWLGQPKADTWPIYHAYFGTDSAEALRQRLDDDYRWLSPDWFEGVYLAPVFTLGREKTSHGMRGPLAAVEDPAQLDDFDCWADPDQLYLDECLHALRTAGPVYRASGFWSPFFHIVMDLFGAEDYLVKLYECPEVVHAVTDRVCGYYYEVNRRLFELAGDDIDALFFGNDFGTQRELFLRPEHFREFLLPWIRRFIDLGHAYGYQVIMHSCGAIHQIIGDLIDAGLDALHPLQARASRMDAETIARDFGGRVCFFGGIDTQDLLVHGTPDAVAAEVRRVKAVLGPRVIISPSHEALLPNVPPQNVLAMAEVAHEPWITA
jgi:uroporphyrinogen decarboxylase